MADTSGQRFQILSGNFAVCRLAPDASWPAWARGEFVSLTATADELSIICAANVVPSGIAADREWRVLKVVGPFAFSAVGVLASFTTPLARAGVSLLAVATYETDYLLVKNDALNKAAAVLVAAGHTRLD